MQTWCYWNLHKNCISYKQGSSGKVHHANRVVLRNVRFHVLTSGREKVLKDRQKNVHSFVIGDLIKAHPIVTHPHEAHPETSPESFLEVGFKKAYYNPYTTKTWIDAETGTALHNAASVVIQNKQVWYKTTLVVA